MWEKLKYSNIASSYVQAYCIAGKVIEAEGGNEFLGIGGTPHVGIRKYFYPKNKGLAGKDGIHMPAPPPKLFHIQMGFSFPFLCAKDLRTSLLIMRTCSFLLSCM